MGGGLANYAASRAPAHGLRPTLIDRYLMREVAVRTLVFLAILFPTLLLERGLRLVNQMAAAGAHLGYVFAMVADLAPYYFGSALPAAFLVGLLLTVSRLDEELQIEAMFAAGLSLWRIVGVLVGLGAVVSAICLLIGAYVEPLGHYGFRATRDAAINAGWTAQLQSGAFQAHGDAITLTADVADQGGRRLYGVFAERRSAHGIELVLTAAQATIALEPDGRSTRLHLTNGRLLVDRPGYPPGAGAFAAYDLVIPYPINLQTPPRGSEAKEFTSPELLRRLMGEPGRLSHDEAAAELYGRIGKGLTVPLLPLIALPLGMAASRGRRSGGFTIAGVIILTFYEGLRLTQSLASSGRLDPLLSIGGLYVAFLAISAWVFLSSRRLQGDWGIAAAVVFIQGLVDRRPRLRLKGPRLPFGRRLPRYLTYAFAANTFGAAAAISGLVGIIDLFERTDDILARGLGLGGVLHYGLLRAPVILEQFAPLAVLAGAAFAFLRLSRLSEMLAMRASGRSLLQLLGMAMPTAVCASVVIGLLAEVVSPAAQLDLARWWSASTPAAEATPTLRWYRLGDEITRVGRIAPDGAVLRDITQYRRGPDGLLETRLAAGTATLTAGAPSAFRIPGAALTTVGRARPTMERAYVIGRTTMTPHDLAAIAFRPLQIGARDAWRQLRGLAPNNQGDARPLTRLHRSLAEPLAAILMLLAACPLGLASPRSGPAPWRIAFVAGFGMIYLTADGFMTAMGQTGLAPAWIGAWAAPLVLGGLALVVALFSED